MNPELKSSKVDRVVFIIIRSAIESEASKTKPNGEITHAIFFSSKLRLTFKMVIIAQSRNTRGIILIFISRHVSFIVWC